MNSSFRDQVPTDVALWLYKQDKVQSVTNPDALPSDVEASTRRIRCPQCQWQPNASSRWCCSDCPYPELFFSGCETVWNTFDTAGLCPGCAHQWHWTACLSCGQWSLHSDWYEDHKEP